MYTVSPGLIDRCIPGKQQNRGWGWGGVGRGGGAPCPDTLKGEETCSSERTQSSSNDLVTVTAAVTVGPYCAMPPLPKTWPPSLCVYGQMW